jgi:hypothetical protein
MSTTVYPTHQCFDDVTEIVALVLVEGTLTSDVAIVHGIIAPDGVDISHAWVERGKSSVVFAGIVNGEKCLVECDLDEYYQQSIVKDKTAYTIEDAIAEEIRCGHGGPWVGRYRALCKEERGL